MVLLRSRVRSPRYYCARYLLWAMRVWNYSPILVPQEAYQDAISTLEHLPSSSTSFRSFNDVDDAALTLAPTTSMRELILAYLATPQEVPDSWSLPTQRTSRHCFNHDSSCSCSLDTKILWIQTPSRPIRRFAILHGLGWPLSPPTR